MRQLFVFERPARFVAGTVGAPGERTFYLQAVDGPRVVSVAIDEEFRVAAMGLKWDGDAGLVVIEAQAPVESVEEAEETLLADVEDGPDALRVLIDPRVARSFVERARRVVSAGRPPCPLCSQPLDPAGHVCVRLNGYHRGSALQQ
jgi:hypothetical protein